MSKRISIFLNLALGLFALGAASAVLAIDNVNQPVPMLDVNQGSGDAIGIRVVPNPSHYSIYRWYESQGFAGSPQALVVDGYEAIRDGRTVYVNATNVDPDARAIYTNVYLISYNQEPAPYTVDILGQIIAHWKFNSNISESSDPPPACSVSAWRCASDSQCSQDQYCASSGLASGTCLLKEDKYCLTDGECPSGFYCDSLKAKIIRDAKRAGKLEELKEALFKFKQTSGQYPNLAAGTYLKGRSVSTWPSWSQSLLASLSAAESLSDPINRLGPCPGYDPETCWQESSQQFAYPPEPNYLKLPAGSYAMAYSTDANGSNYNLCAVLETRDPALDFHFSPNDPAASNCVTGTGIGSGGQATNTPPYIVTSSLAGEAGREYNGFIKAADREGNPMTWNLNTGGGNWLTWKNDGQINRPPVLKPTADAGQKKIYAEAAGAPGIYNTILTINDGQGGVLATTVPLAIANPKPFVEADNGQYTLDPVLPFIYSFYFSDNNLSAPASAYLVTKEEGPANGFDLLNGAGLTKTLTNVGINRYQVKYEGVVPTSFKFTDDTSFRYRITVTDDYGAKTEKEFTLRLLVARPSLNFNCPPAARLNQPYSCFIGYNQEGNYSLTYTSNPLPQALVLGAQLPTTTYEEEDYNTSFDFRNYFRQFWGSLAKLVSSPAAFGLGVQESIYLHGEAKILSQNQPINIKATNEYGTFSEKNFYLSINNYCGDGVKQSPNTENRGGFYNDGYEDCDGTSGTTSSPSNSSPSLQYGCRTGINFPTPYPIPNNTYCVFKSPIGGGGYCGDTYCQTDFENIQSCGVDCGTTCIPNCANKQCGNDGCGSSCPPGCPGGQECNVNGQCDALPFCGDGICQAANGENCSSCEDDCACGSSQACCGGVCQALSEWKVCGDICCNKATECCHQAAVHWFCTQKPASGVCVVEHIID